MERCADMAHAGVDIRAIQYADLVGSGGLATLAALLEHCHLPAAAAQTKTRALPGDSKADPIVAGPRQRHYRITRADHDSIREVLAPSALVDEAGFLPKTRVKGLLSRTRDPPLDSWVHEVMSTRCPARGLPCPAG